MVSSLLPFCLFPLFLPPVENSSLNSSGSRAYTGCSGDSLHTLPAICRPLHDYLCSLLPFCTPIRSGQTGFQKASVLVVTSVVVLFVSCYLCSTWQCQLLRSTVITQLLSYYALVRHC